ncbi:hypothetical protein [Helicobacter canis]|uniref:hypothetical protein n=1 Tax=Helicobacter canis TaxID=29419 RepID=UPI0026EA51B2|nr:hypothetical protein [Helicobacter canis]
MPRPRSLQFAYIQQSKEKMWDKAFGIYATLQDFFIEFLCFFICPRLEQESLSLV